MGTKEEPGKFNCYHAAEDDEPMFVLLARDPLAPSLVKMWADLRAAFDIGDPEKVRAAEECADAMLEWAANHPDHGPLAK